jgi:RNA polymerase sigma factor (sigma-70 family)
MPPPDAETARWFTEHVQAHEAVLRGYLRGLVTPSDVDDIVQETYVRMLRARSRGQIDSPRGLLFATARNVAKDLFRRRATARTISVAEVDVSHVLDGAPSVPDRVSRANEADLLRAAIKSLPDRCREILILRKFENLSHREIAQKLGIAEHTVEAQLTKALHRCEDFFAKRGALPSK